MCSPALGGGGGGRGRGGQRHSHHHESRRTPHAPSYQHTRSHRLRQQAWWTRLAPNPQKNTTDGIPTNNIHHPRMGPGGRMSRHTECRRGGGGTRRHILRADGGEGHKARRAKYPSRSTLTTVSAWNPNWPATNAGHQGTPCVWRRPPGATQHAPHTK